MLSARDLPRSTRLHARSAGICGVAGGQAELRAHFQPAESRKVGESGELSPREMAKLKALSGFVKQPGVSQDVLSRGMPFNLALRPYRDLSQSAACVCLCKL